MKKNKTKIHVSKADKSKFRVSEMKIDPFWAELLNIPSKRSRYVKK